MVEKAEDTNAGGVGPNGNAIPELVEVEVDGKKVKVEKGAEGFLMKEKDYRQKTQSLADERRQLEKERESLKSELDSARGLMGFLSSDEKAYGVVTALLSGDKSQARKLLEDEGGSEIETIKKEVEALKVQLRTKDIRDQDSAKKTQQYADAKRRLKDEHDIDLDEIYPLMVERGTKDSNPYVPWAVTTALDKIKKKAEEVGKKSGFEEALKELSLKLDNTPPISSGAGENSRGGKKSQAEAIVSALNRLQEEKIRGGST